MGKRMSLTVEGGHTWAAVGIRYWAEIEGRMVRRTFRVSGGPGSHYVREGDGQVCEELASMGDTLTASPATLASVIRREYRAMRRAEARELRPRY